ncbi:EamA family transporter [Nocardioides salsibiostraticola]
MTDRSQTATGLGFALLSAISFGLSGSLASPMLDQGWSPGAVVLIRVAIAAVAVVPFGLVALHGRWYLVREHAGVLTVYGVFAVAGAQFGYFSAVQYMQVAPALLIEYTAPAAVVMWLWLRHGERPGRITLLGAGLAVLGLVLLLDLLSGAEVSVIGMLWGLFAMLGAATYFIISADDTRGLPPIVLASGGLVVGTIALGGLGLVGLLSMETAPGPVDYDGVGLTASWWIPLVLLGLVTAGVAYTSGIAAGRRLGSRLASFVALTEVLAAVLWAWLLLDELAGPLRLFGGVLIIAGVVVVKLGERRIETMPTNAEVPTSAS